MEDGQGKIKVATFAGGCFWCMQRPFDDLQGVVKTVPGYTGGDIADPSYEEVSSGSTGHAEAVQVHFDPALIGYADLLQVFWRNIDPTQRDGQFCDHGSQYRSAIFYGDENEYRLAMESLKAIEETGRFEAIHTKIEPLSDFFSAEEYHQDYYKKNPIRYKFYRSACGRDRRLKQLWND